MPELDLVDEHLRHVGFILRDFFASAFPAARQMSSPTVSASSAGPIGMPKSSIARSSVSGFTPWSSMRNALYM